MVKIVKYETRSSKHTYQKMIDNPRWFYTSLIMGICIQIELFNLKFAPDQILTQATGTKVRYVPIKGDESLVLINNFVNKVNKEIGTKIPHLKLAN